MLFNSIEFLIFLPIVFILYWFVFKEKRSQNLLIVAVSYLFYGWWDWRFLILIAFTTLCSFFSGILLEKHQDDRDRKRWICGINITLNLLILCVFKYFNFFAESFSSLFNSFGYKLDWVMLDLLLPVGISFYTFQALSYTIDVYRKKNRATHDPVAFFAFISFFPQLVAGPIERSTNLLPQFYKARHFDYKKSVEGLRLILWGFFKKIVVADTCAQLVNFIFLSPELYNGSALFLGGFFFAFQIYGDFSGYSDIAIGTAKLFNIDLLKNFNMPYFSRSIPEFWKRWHISLNTWFVDYLYIPLGGSRVSKLKVIRNTFAIFLVSGLWHGANWTFVLWGAFHACLFMPYVLLNKKRKPTDVVAQNSTLPSVREMGQMLSTFILVIFGWIIFRADSIQDTVNYFRRMCSFSLFEMPNFRGFMLLNMCEGLIVVFILLAVEWINRREDFGFKKQPHNTLVRSSIYVVVALICLLFFRADQQFIYFQF